MSDTQSVPLDFSVGAQIRERRKAARIPLQVLSEKTGLSIGYLSQIERGISSASLRAMALIAEGLGIDLSMLFVSGQKPLEDDQVIFTQRDHSFLTLNLEGVHKVLLTPGGKPGDLRLFLMTVEPGGNSGDDYYSHTGEEAGTILEGALELTVDGRTHLLKAGDAFRFRSTRPHRFSNYGPQTCRVLWINVN